MRKYFETASKSYDISRLSEALSLYQSSLNLAYQIEDQDCISSIPGNIGLIYSDQGELCEALKYFTHAKELAA